MQTLLFNSPVQDIDDILWARAARRECVEYGEHGTEVEEIDGRLICFNCGDRVESRLSACCGAPVSDFGFCSDCKENA
jgi:hypothetical protein